MRNEKLTIFIGAEKLRLVKRYKTSIAEFRRILEFDPEDASILEKIGDVYSEWKKPQECVQEYRNALDKYLKNNGSRKAFKCCNKILNLDPEDKFGHKAATLEKLEVINAQIADEEEKARIEEEKERKLALQEEVHKEMASLESPLFQDSSLEELTEIAKVTNVIELSKGDILFRQGDPGESLYIIDQGVMEVVLTKKGKGKKDSEGLSQYIPEDQETPIVELERGDFFGEISFLAGSNRTATLAAKEDSKLFEISREDFREVLKVFPKMEDKLLEYYKVRVLDLILAKSPLFSFLDKDQRDELCKYFVLTKYNKGEVIIEEGSESRDLYLIKYGIVKVVTNDPSKKQVVLTKLQAHSFFGEVSFLTGSPRTANVIAATPTELLVFSHKNLTNVIQKYPRTKEIMQNFLKKRVFQTIKKFKIV